METTVTEQVAVLKNQAKFSDKVNMQPILTANGGRVVLVAMKRNQGLAEHEAPGKALVTVLEGRAVFDFEGAETPVNAGEYFTMEKGTKHSVRAAEDSKILLSIFG